MFNEAALEEAVEEYLIKELRKQAILHLDDILEDTITNTMKKVVVRLYQKKATEGVRFEIEIKKDDND